MGAQRFHRRYHRGSIASRNYKSAPANRSFLCRSILDVVLMIFTDAKHRGFAFVTYGSSADAQDAIDNMDLNEMSGKVLKVNLARPMKGQLQVGGNRAGRYLF